MSTPWVLCDEFDIVEGTLMELSEWWASNPDERYWLEITDRNDLGVDLKAPQLRDDGKPFWGYSLVRAASSPLR